MQLPSTVLAALLSGPPADAAADPTPDPTPRAADPDLRPATARPPAEAIAQMAAGAAGIAAVGLRLRALAPLQLRLTRR